MTTKRKSSRRGKSGAHNIRVTYSPRHGVHVEGSVLWLDGFPNQGLGFLSHAHIKPTRHAGKILTSHHTAILTNLQGPNVLVSPFDRRFSVGQMDVELFPSGHVPGAASLLAQWDGQEVLYAGSVNPRGTIMAAEPCQTRTCDILILGSRYGHPRFSFPDPEEAAAQLLDLIHRTLDQGRIPILFFSEPLGKVQALAARLYAENVDVWVHRKIYEFSTKLGNLGWPTGHPRKFKPSSFHGGAILWLTGSRTTQSVTSIRHPVTILISGAAADPAAFDWVDHRIVLSDHADFDSLVGYVEQVHAKTVWLLPGRPHGLAATLKQQGRRVSVLHPTQLALF
ncbi:MAG: hypothetical protein J7M25_17895 [Deltaproteobacteria bacterium]|nr:hypothetical protein [Deltaproteobacteria bacterium]